jgi:uncharacterized protein (TIGR02996 family)
MYGLTLLGDPHPLSPRALSDALAQDHARVPTSYLKLLATWGPGWLCNVFELPDPTDPNGRFRHLQDVLHVEAVAQRRDGAWPQLSELELAQGVVLGVDRRGFAILTRSATELALLHPRGMVFTVGSFDDLVRNALLGGALLATQRARIRDVCHDDLTQGWRHNLLGVPSIYLTDGDLPRADLLAAWVAGDEAAADAALARVLETEVAMYALMELLHHLASPAAADISASIRASYADQLYRMAHRRLPELVPGLPIREIRDALGKGELAPGLLAQVAAILEPPAGSFVGQPSRTERALLATVAAEPSDTATRIVYADQLEQLGAVARAEAVRGEALVPLADAVERGFIAPPRLGPIDATARIRERIECWRAADPSVDIDALVAKIDRLHPTARAGYEILIAQLSDVGHDHRTAGAHLVREIRDAWPQLALALRSSDGTLARTAIEVLIRAKARDAAPFLRSLLRHPARPGTYLRAADGFARLGKVTQDVCEELAPHLAPDATVRAGLEQIGIDTVRRAAFRLLHDFGHDDRVFEGALRWFCEEHPHTERVLRKRRTEPRVGAVLGERLAAEEARSLKNGGRFSSELGLLARYLSKLGDAHATEILDRYQQAQRGEAKLVRAQRRSDRRDL